MSEKTLKLDTLVIIIQLVFNFASIKSCTHEYVLPLPCFPQKHQTPKRIVYLLEALTIKGLQIDRQLISHLNVYYKN